MPAENHAAASSSNSDAANASDGTDRGVNYIGNQVRSMLGRYYNNHVVDAGSSVRDTDDDYEIPKSSSF